MQTVNIRNISLSLCLGIFSFHMYVVNTYNLGSKQSSSFDIVYRGLAAQENLKNCTQTDISPQDFKESSYQPEQCKYFVSITPSYEKQTLQIKIYMKQNKSLVQYPGENDKKLILTVPDDLKFVNGDNNKSAKAAAKKLELNSKVQEYIPLLETKLATAVKAAQDKAPPATNSSGDKKEKAEEATTDTDALDANEEDVVASEETPEITSNDDEELETVLHSKESREDADEEDDEDKDEELEEVREILTDFDRFNRAHNTCTLSSEASKEFKKILKNKNHRKLISKRDRINGDLEKFNETDITRAFTLQEELDDFDSGSDEDLDLNTILSCLSKNAPKTNKELYYLKNIQPVLSAVINGASNSPEELKTVLDSINSPEFIALQTNNPTIEKFADAQVKIATEAVNCKAQQDKSICITQLRTALATAQLNYQNSSATNPNDLNNLAVLKLEEEEYKKWLAELSPKTTTESKQGSVIDNVLEDTLSPGIKGIEDLAELNKVLELTRATLTSVKVRDANFGASARSKVIKVYSPNSNGNLGVVGDLVPQDQLNGNGTSRSIDH